MAEVEEKQLTLLSLSLFNSSLHDYDFVLQLDKSLVTHSRRKSDSAFKNLQLDASSNIANIGFDPAADFLAELESVYGAAIMFFSGTPERTAIGGLWTPQTADRPWRINLGYSTLTVQSGGDVLAKVNKAAILAEIARLGGDLIAKIEVKQ